MDTGGQTIAATRFAELTGVSRDRLRTWERRFGFPQPVRVGDGRRRYAAEDVARVVAVRRAAEEGAPLAVAIAAVGVAGDPLPAGALRATVELAPVPVALIGGPEPLRLVWGNATLRAVRGAPPQGALLSDDHLGHDARQALRRHFTDDLPPLELGHVAWSGPDGPRARSLAYRLPCGPGEPALVALVASETRGERDARRALAGVEAELATVSERADRHDRWLDALARLAEVFQRESGPEVIDTALDIVVRHTRVLDAGVGSYLSGRLVLVGSRRGMFGASTLTVAGHPELGRALRDVDGTWLEPATRARLGVSEELEVAAMPIVVGGEPLGMLVMAFEERVPHDDDHRRLLASLSAGVGFAMLRDRLVNELQVTLSPASRPAPPGAAA